MRLFGWRETLVTLHECKSMLVGVALVCGVMLLGPLKSQASPADGFASSSAKLADKGQPKHRVWLAERFGTMLAAPKVTQKTFDLSTISPQDFGDSEPDAASN
jgi:hypothetical protein